MAEETGTTFQMWEDETEELWTADDKEIEEPELVSGLSLPQAIVDRLSDTTLPTIRVRRLTPTECERLQGFPDGWTIPSESALATWGRSISTQLDGTSSDALARSLSSRGSPPASAQ
jgi:site-specific DNA-cytosine methylase